MSDIKLTKAKHSFQERHFLNNIEIEHSGSVKLDFDVRRKGTKAKGYHWTLNGGLEIRDCSRRIDLHFDGNTKRDKSTLENSKQKLQRLMSACQRGLDVIEAMEAKE